MGTRTEPNAATSELSTSWLSQSRACGSALAVRDVSRAGHTANPLGHTASLAHKKSRVSPHIYSGLHG
jgi:hypothetical protein